MRLLLAVVALATLALGGCGGGGGGSSSSILLTGNVIDVTTGNAPNPAASVQVGGTSVFASTSDGSFSIAAPAGTSSILVSGTGIAFTFHFPPVTASTALGNLYIGPQQITVTGSVVKAADETPIAGATVSFAGQTGITDASGVFNLPGVAYSSKSAATFFGINGSVMAAGFVTTSFNASGQTPNAQNVLALPAIQMSPTSDPNPPGVPFNIWGQITPTNKAAGTVVTLSLNGTPVRSFTVSATALYSFWVSPGTYTLSFANGSLTSENQTVTLSAPNDVQRRDATLH